LADQNFRVKRGLEVGLGATVLTALPSGFVGIGTTNPTYKVQIDDTAVTGAGLLVRGGGAGGPLARFQRNIGGSATVEINGSGADPQIVFTGFTTFSVGANLTDFEIANATALGTNTRFLINSSGNTGIGTTNPSQLLHVQGNAYVSGNTGIGTTSIGAKLHVIPGASSIAGLFSGSTSDDMIRITQTGTGNCIRIEDEANPDSTPFVIHSAGPVGAGTTNPGAQLHVVPTSTSISGLFSGTTSSDMVRITQLGTGNALVVEDSANPDSTPFVVTGIGSVGIAITNPQTALHLGGGGNIRLNRSDNTRSSLIFHDNNGFNINANTSGDDVTINAGNTSGRILLQNNSSTTLTAQSGTVLVGTATSTGTASQPLQVTGGAYVSDSVGIGTTNPGATLNVVPTSTGIAGLFSGTTSSDMVRITQLGTGNALVVEDSANPDTTPFVVTGIGSVGIGTKNPQSKLHIAGGGTINTGTTIATFNNSSNQSRITIIDENGTGTKPPGMRSPAASYGLGLYAPGGPIIFYNEAAETEKARVASGGEFLIGAATLTGTSSQLLQVTGGAYVSGNLGIGSTNPTSKLHVIGDILASGNVTGYSDESLKENIQTISNGLDKVIQLRGVEFNRKDMDGNPHQIGVIAQEVEKVIPEVVSTQSNGIKSVAYGNIIGVLIEAIKEQQQQIEFLKKEINTLR